MSTRRVVLFSFVLVAVVASFSSRAAAVTAQTVAVMPFRDLSGAKASIGEAIRETVTSDLREISGMKVIERGNLDRVLQEQKLQGTSDFDTATSAKVGKLLGATLIVTGAYQQSGDTVRLTARLIRVQTGEIFGAAKVDGKATAVLSLQDRLTGQLLQSAGMKAPPPKKRFTVKSWKTMEVYADAVVETDPQKRAAILQRLVGEDPDFVYARQDLDALQGRMKGYGETSSVQLSQSEQATMKKLAGKLDASERQRMQRALFAEMIGARRFHSLESAVSTLLQQAGGRGPEDGELQYALFVARERLHKFDLALQNGEAYLKAFPTGAHFRDVEGRMNAIAETKKKRANRRAEYEADLKEKLADTKPGTLLHDHAPCICTRWNCQVGELMLQNCSAFLKKWEGRATEADDKEKLFAARFFVILALQELGDFSKAKPLADKLIADSDEWDQELRAMMGEWPTD